MKDKFFIDTNIFVYLIDNKNPAKQKIAQKIVEQALDDNRGIISSQVIQEFFNVVTQKVRPPMRREHSSDPG